MADCTWRPWIVGAVAWVALFPHQTDAANWSPRNGHPRITYRAAIGSGIPSSVARVMALASVTPDYFEFDHPEAHAQREDPPWRREGRTYRMLESNETCQQRYREAKERSDRWREFYFQAAVTVLKHGGRERAAFLLAYSLHNTQDFATHRLMSNLHHAGLSYVEGDDPDSIPERVEEAERRSTEELARFRRVIGEPSWRFFTSREPLPVWGAELASWDPTATPIPPVKDRQGFSRNTQRGEEIETNRFRSAIVTRALFPREQQMVRWLTEGIERGSGTPRAPREKGLWGLVKLGLQGRRFQHTLSQVYRHLEEDDRRRLHACWEEAQLGVSTQHPEPNAGGEQ
ncbi:MAG: hypothetical protein HYZ89_05105 [Candidatus Omnitrophica bacterium]|nr:hypothetical protein [Candidatus Omnitrophota bacterium]